MVGLSTSGDWTVTQAQAEAALAIVDAHQHFWDPVSHYYPWLNDEPPIAFRYGDYRAVKRRYLPPDYRMDAAPFRVEKSVYVEAEWNPQDPLGEMRYIELVRTTYGLPTVAVAQAWLDNDDAPHILEKQAAIAFVRSVRHKPRANQSPNDTAPGGMTDAKWREGFAQVVRNGLRFDLQTPWWHLGEAAQLATAYPDSRIILNHTGLPADRSDEGLRGWKRAMATLASCPNVTVKISGLGQPGATWTVAANSDIVRTTIDLFGAARCMFASNFPVDTAAAAVTASSDRMASDGAPAEILVCNAGIVHSEVAAETMTDAQWTEVIDVNLNGLFWCCRAFGRHMLAAKRGSIVNVGSMSGLIVNKPQGQASYNASKPAVHTSPSRWPPKWGARGVRVNAVAPTYISTPLNEFVKSKPAMYQAWIDGTAMARMGTVDEIASVAHFLASDAASLMTGSVVVVDGGYTCW